MNRSLSRRIVRRACLLAAAQIVAFTSWSAVAQEAAKPTAPAAGASVYKEFILGNPKSKVTVIEYASLTCSHCARFAQTVYPEIKKNYIETGKIRFVFRDYPLDGLAMAGAALARCAPQDRGMKMIEMMFKNQDTWVRAEKPIEPLKSYALLAGMTAPGVEACLKNDALLKIIKDEQTKATNLYKVQATPTFYVDDEKLDGEHTYEDFAKILDKHIAKAK